MSSHDASGSTLLLQTFAQACKSHAPLIFKTRHRSSGAEESFTISSPYLFLGRSHSAGIRLDDPSISQCHAYFQVIEGEVYCVDCGSRTGVLWEDGTQSRGWVHYGQTVRLGAFDVRVEQSEPGDQSPQSGSGVQLAGLLTVAAVDIFLRSQKAPTLHTLDRPLTLIGRHPACDLRLMDDSIGYFQAAIVNTPDGLWYLDTMSRHGALLNGRQCRLARLRDSDLLELGRVSLVFRLGTHSSNNSVAVNEFSSSTPLGGMAMAPANMAEAVAGMFMPVGEMVKQFQQCFMSMAQMFAAMQQEHSLLVSEQMRQIQEMAEELRSLRMETRGESQCPKELTASSPHPSPLTAATPAGTPIAPHASSNTAHATPRPPLPGQNQSAEEKFPDAHSWFMKRLAAMGQGPNSNSANT